MACRIIKHRNNFFFCLYFQGIVLDLIRKIIRNSRVNFMPFHLCIRFIQLDVAYVIHQVLQLSAQVLDSYSGGPRFECSTIGCLS
jgi:hypothetical protein